MFATLLNSRINSWVSWLFLTCRENKQISHAPCTLHSSICYKLRDIINLPCTTIHTWAAILCSTSRIHPSWSRTRFKLIPLHARPCPHPIMFVLALPATRCLSQQFTFHTYNPPFTTGGLNTFIQVKIMGARHSMYNGRIYSLQLFFLWFCLIPGQASWPRTFMSGTLKTADHSCILR